MRIRKTISREECCLHVRINITGRRYSWTHLHPLSHTSEPPVFLSFSGLQVSCKSIIDASKTNHQLYTGVMLSSVNAQWQNNSHLFSSKTIHCNATISESLKKAVFDTNSLWCLHKGTSGQIHYSLCLHREIRNRKTVLSSVIGQVYKLYFSYKNLSLNQETCTANHNLRKQVWIKTVWFDGKISNWPCHHNVS